MFDGRLTAWCLEQPQSMSEGSVYCITWWWNIIRVIRTGIRIICKRTRAAFTLQLQELNTISRWEATEQEVPVLNKKVGCVGWGRNYCADTRTSVMITVAALFTWHPK